MKFNKSINYIKIINELKKDKLLIEDETYPITKYSDIEAGNDFVLNIIKCLYQYLNYKCSKSLIELYNNCKSHFNKLNNKELIKYINNEFINVNKLIVNYEISKINKVMSFKPPLKKDIDNHISKIRNEKEFITRLNNLIN